MVFKSGSYPGKESIQFDEWLRNLVFPKTWTPTTTLTVVNTPTYAGRYTKVGNLLLFRITITAGGVNTTASVAGTSYITLPFAGQGYGICIAARITTLIAIGTGIVDSAAARVYPPTWAATNDNIIVGGLYEL